MTMDSLAFVYLFLPLAVSLFYCTPNIGKKPVLMLITLAYYLLAAPNYLLLLVAPVAFDYSFVRLMEAFDDQPMVRRICLGIVVGKDVFLLLQMGREVEFLHYLLHLGVLISALNGLGYMIELYQRKSPYEHNFIDFFLFTSFFGTLLCGPIVQYRELMPQLKKLRPSLTSISKGVVLFVIGLAKKVVLGDTLLQTYSELWGLFQLEPVFLVTFFMLLSLALAVFFLFSAYSDMARGVGYMFSLEYPRNFYYPYQAKTVTEWLERFNMSFYSFCQRNLQLPIKDEKWGTLIIVGNLLLLGLLMGFWFGLQPGFLLWGLILSGFILLERYVYGKQLQKLPTILRRGYTFTVMLLAFTAFAGRDLPTIAAIVKSIGDFTRLSTTSPELRYLLSTNWAILLVGLVLSTSVIDLAAVYCRKKLPALADGVAVCGNLVLLLATTAFMLG